jgi:hypothetical protein
VEAQQISQVEATAVGDKIQVTCELQSNTPLDLYLLYSEDGQVFKPCATVTGDIFKQTSGHKTILWDYAADGIIMGKFIFKVYSIPAEIVAMEEVEKAAEKPIQANNMQTVQQPVADSSKSESIADTQRDDELRFFDMANTNYKIHDSSDRKLSNSEVKQMLAYSPDALSYYKRGKRQRTGGYTVMVSSFFLGPMITVAIASVGDMSFLLAGSAITLLFLIPEYFLLKEGKRNISKAVSIYNNGLPATKTSDLSLKFGGTKSGGIGFTLTF